LSATECAGLQLNTRGKARHFRPILKRQPVPNPVSHSINALSDE
jgi:hypothetical protein